MAPPGYQEGMASIEAKTAEILTRARDVRKLAGQGTVSLFGFRLRSSGFALTATLSQIQAMDRNAKVAVKAIQQLDGAAAELTRLGEAAKAELDRAQADLERIVRAGQAAQVRYDGAVARVRELQRRLDRDPENEGLIEQVNAAVDQANEAASAIDRINAEIGRAESVRDEAAANLQAVSGAVDEFQRIAPTVCAEIGKAMGLENVFFEERRFDPAKEWIDDTGKKRTGDYSGDVMSFEEKAQNLLRAWASTPEQAVEIVSWQKDKPEEKPTDPINPLTRRAFTRTRDEEYDAEIEDKKTGEKKKVRMVRRLVLGDEVLIASKLGALGLYRKMLQRMMEDIVATVTRKHA